MITACGEDVAFAMCMGCPVPKAAVEAFCHMLKGAEALERGNLCLLREIERRRPGSLTFSKSVLSSSVGAKKLKARRRELLKSEK